MHNIDRTTFETGFGEYESDEYEYGEVFEGEGEGEGEYEYEGEGEYYAEVFGESPFNEAEEMELAAELLGVTNEHEMDLFIGKLLKRAGRAAGKFIKSPIGQRIGGFIKSAAKRALPILGKGLGNAILPGVGGIIGGKLASAAGSMLGLELEGLSHEDQEFEVARQIVRLGGAAAANAAKAGPTAPPQKVAQRAFVTAAQQYAPGLLKGNTAVSGQVRCQCGRRQTGRWIRRGKSIILIGA